MCQLGTYIYVSCELSAEVFHLLNNNCIVCLSIAELAVSLLYILYISVLYQIFVLWVLSPSLSCLLVFSWTLWMGPVYEETSPSWLCEHELPPSLGQFRISLSGLTTGGSQCRDRNRDCWARPMAAALRSSLSPSWSFLSSTVLCNSWWPQPHWTQVSVNSTQQKYHSLAPPPWSLETGLDNKRGPSKWLLPSFLPFISRITVGLSVVKVWQPLFHIFTKFLIVCVWRQFPSS